METLQAIVVSLWLDSGGVLVATDNSEASCLDPFLYISATLDSWLCPYLRANPGD